MSADNFTTTPHAAAQYDRDHTPGPGLRDDELLTKAHMIADANGGIVAASTLERRLRLGHSEAVRIAAIVNGERA